MAKIKQKQQALDMRKQGMSYSQIKNKIKVSKSSLSLWLRKYPLSRQRISELRGRNPARIERFRNTMSIKREKSFDEVFQKVKSEIGKLSQRDILIGGIFLYWGEGTKSSDYETSVSNTDPNALKFFIRWLSLFGISKTALRVTLHLYQDMDKDKELAYWSKELNLPASCFRKPYVKNSNLADISYKNGFGHGTCNVRYFNKEMWQYIRMALKHVRGSRV